MMTGFRDRLSVKQSSKSILGDIVTTLQGIPDLRVLNTGFNNCDKPIIQVAKKSKFVKIDLNRKQNG
jgi:hypothetical protein